MSKNIIFSDEELMANEMRKKKKKKEAITANQERGWTPEQKY